MDSLILETFSYFNQFDYAPTLQELYCFYKKEIKFEYFIEKVDEFRHGGAITKHKRLQEYDFKFFPDTSIFRYTTGEYEKGYYNTKIANTISKMAIANKVTRFLGVFPQVRMIGISGSLAMRNAADEDDIDLFVISSENRLWTARIICLMITIFLRIRRGRNSIQNKDKICLNLFFDYHELSLPIHKRTQYGAHEVLQMKPVLVKGSTYRDFLKSNDWIFEIFPNARMQLNYVENMLASEEKSKFPTARWDFYPGKLISLLGDLFELLSKKLQMRIMKGHVSHEIISKYQLWFFPHDHEKQLKHDRPLQ